MVYYHLTPCALSWYYSSMIDTQTTSPGKIGSRRRVLRGLSLQPEHESAVRYLATEQGHGNVSRIIQDLIESEMRERIGRDWRTAFPAVEAVPA